MTTESSGKGSERPNYLLALGNRPIPQCVRVDDEVYTLSETFKHDSWAATAVYANGDKKIVCKHNRIQSIFVVPTFWLGYFLAYRETYFLRKLHGLPGIPKCYEVYTMDGKRLRNTAAHDFVPGTPMSLVAQLPERFFENLFQLIHELHRHQIAYIDLHKQENVIVGDDGLPYLIDFQISLQLPNMIGIRSLFKLLAQSDLYHVQKHQLRRGCEHWAHAYIEKPWWIRLHRAIAVPFRAFRRRLLVIIGVRRGDGKAQSEIAPEVGLRASHSAQ